LRKKLLLIVNGNLSPPTTIAGIATFVVIAASVFVNILLKDLTLYVKNSRILHQQSNRH
jgi:hypothetical protein